MAFIGMVEDYEEYKKTSDKQENNVVGTGNRIAYDDMEPISDEDLLILQQTRNRHDPYTVYMQSDVSFYDSFYNRTEEDNTIDPDLLKEVKNIKRVYKNYPAYSAAMFYREKYMNALVEKYGGETLYNFYSDIGMIRDWIPPIPIYSKTSSDYKFYQNGYYVAETINDWDDDKIIDAVNTMAEEEFGEDSEIEFVSEVETDPVVLSHSGLSDDNGNNAITYRGTPNNSIGTISANDIEGLQQMIRSWWHEDEVKKEAAAENNPEMFRLSPDKIKEQYYNESFIDLRGLTEAFESGRYEEKDDFDPDKMVIDPATNRPMTAGELQTRQLIRHLAKNGWNEMGLLRRLGVGSNYEMRLLEQKKRNRKIANKKASSLVADIMGEDTDLIDDVSSLEQLLFDD